MTSKISTRESQSMASESELQDGRWSRISLPAIVLLFVAVRLWRLTSTCLWFDEIFSVHAARHSWTELVRFVAADIIHPPLFYVLLKLWITVGGESLLWLRLLPALLAIAAIVPFILLCRELKLGATALNAGLLLLAVNGYLIKYAQELRMYSLLMFLSICSLLLFFKVFRHPGSSFKPIFWLSLVNLLLVYSHYAGWVLVVTEGLVVVIWSRQTLRKFLAGLSVAIVAYIPWIYLLANSDSGSGLKQNIGWMTRPGVRDLVQFYSLLNKPFWSVQSSAAQPHDLLTAFAALLIFGIPLVLLFLRVWRSPSNENRGRLQALSVIAITPIVIVFVLSWLLPESVWGTRHLIIVAAPYFMLVAVGVTELKHHWARITIYATAAAWFVLAGATWARSRPPVYIWCTWEPLAKEVAADRQQAPPVPIYAFEDLIAYHVWYALEPERQKEFSIYVARPIEGVQEDLAYFLPRRFTDIATVKPEQITSDDIWITYRAPSFDETRAPLSKFVNIGYQVADKRMKQAQGEQAFMVHLVRKH